MKKFLSGGMLCCVFSAALFAFGQSATTSLRSVVKDSSGALVPGAIVTLKDQANDNAYRAVCDAAGFYVFPVIAPAHYLVTVSFMGGRPAIP